MGAQIRQQVISGATTIGIWTFVALLDVVFIAMTVHWAKRYSAARTKYSETRRYADEDYVLRRMVVSWVCYHSGHDSVHIAYDASFSCAGRSWQVS